MSIEHCLIIYLYVCLSDCLSVCIGLFLSDLISSYFVSPTLLRVVRVFRVGRILRLVKSAKGIRTLLFSLAVSMPALFNIGLLLFLVMFIYSIFGMSFFMHVKHTKGIDDMFNFETFFRSMILLFQVSTSAGWDSVLAGLMNEEDCDRTPTDIKLNGDCGSTGEAIVFLVTYLVISFLVVINMYIAVILENFSQATEDVQQGLTQDDFDMYYEVWERYDEKATQFIPLSQVSELVDALEEPLRLPAPNFFKLVSLDILICDGDRVHCLDILDALTKNFIGTASDASGVDLQIDLRMGPVMRSHQPVSSTLRRQREIYCATLIQRAWRRYAAAAAATKRTVQQEEDEEHRKTSMDISICDGDCLDILEALTKNFIGIAASDAASGVDIHIDQMKDSRPSSEETAATAAQDLRASIVFLEHLPV